MEVLKTMDRNIQNVCDLSLEYTLIVTLIENLMKTRLLYI